MPQSTGHSGGNYRHHGRQRRINRSSAGAGSVIQASTPRSLRDSTSDAEAATARADKLMDDALKMLASLPANVPDAVREKFLGKMFEMRM